MFWENIIYLCNERGISPNGLCIELGLSNAIATKWKKGSIPHNTTLKKIADYFGVSVDFLLGRTNVREIKKENSPATADEGVLDEYLIRRLSSLTPEELAQVNAFVQGLLANRKD